MPRRALWRRAANLLAGRGEPEAAALDLARAGDPDGAARLLARHGFAEHKVDQAWMIDRGKKIKEDGIESA